MASTGGSYGYGTRQVPPKGSAREESSAKATAAALQGQDLYALLEVERTATSGLLAKDPCGYNAYLYVNEP